ncbi:hypothetical protein DMX04_27600 [Pseudomonas koreensis]|nr:hypothetical protein DMX04_27600 [Pseudomonas koreensis]
MYISNSCGSWLASDGGRSVTNDVDCAGFIAGKPAPTGGMCTTESQDGMVRPRMTAGRARNRSSTRVTLGKF